MKDKWAVLSATVIVLILMGGISVMSCLLYTSDAADD